MRPAKHWGLARSTVQRRLSELEGRIGRKLVARQPAGYRLTEFGETLRPYAERVETAIAELELRASDTSRELTGVIRVTCPEPIVYRMKKSTFLDRFHARYPNLTVEFVTSDRYLDLSKGEVDVAFRSGDTEDELVGRKIANSFWGVLCQPRLHRAARQAGTYRRSVPPSVGRLRRHAKNHRSSVWLREVAPDARCQRAITAFWA